MKYYHYLNSLKKNSSKLSSNFSFCLLFIYFVLIWILCVLIFIGKLIHVYGSKIQSRLRETKSSHSYFTLLYGIFDM